MAEHVKRVRRKRRVRSTRRAWKVTPARIAIFVASAAVGFGIGFLALTYGPRAFIGWRESRLLKRANTNLHQGDYDGWFCPCHGSQYDTSGRIRRGPAPANLPLPPYAFLADTKIRIG